MEKSFFQGIGFFSKKLFQENPSINVCKKSYDNKCEPILLSAKLSRLNFSSLFHTISGVLNGLNTFHTSNTIPSILEINSHPPIITLKITLTFNWSVFCSQRKKNLLLNLIYTMSFLSYFNKFLQENIINFNKI